MWIEFKNYQEKAIVKLKQEVNELLDVEGNKICIFKSPTGSGKTLMMAEFLKRLIDSRIDGKKFSFIWIAVNKLHDQSRNSLKKYYDQFGRRLEETTLSTKRNLERRNTDHAVAGFWGVDRHLVTTQSGSGSQPFSVERMAVDSKTQASLDRG